VDLLAQVDLVGLVDHLLDLVDLEYLVDLRGLVDQEDLRGLVDQEDLRGLVDQEDLVFLLCYYLFYHLYHYQILHVYRIPLNLQKSPRMDLFYIHTCLL
jgi:hypothetical protein